MLSFANLIKDWQIISYHNFRNLLLQKHLESHILKIVTQTPCVKSVPIQSYSGPYSVRIRENADQNNSEYGYFSRSDYDYDTFVPWKSWFKSQQKVIYIFILILIGHLVSAIISNIKGSGFLNVNLFD